MGYETVRHRIEKSRKPEIKDLRRSALSDAKALRRLIDSLPSDLEEGKYGYEGVSNGGEFAQRSTPGQLTPEEEKSLDDIIEKVYRDTGMRIGKKVNKQENKNNINKEEITETFGAKEDHNSYVVNEQPAPATDNPTGDSTEGNPTDTGATANPPENTIVNDMSYNTFESFEEHLISEFNDFIRNMEAKYGERYIPDMTDEEYNELLNRYMNAYGKTSEEAHEFMDYYRNLPSTMEVNSMKESLQDSINMLRELESTMREQSPEVQRDYMKLYNELKEIYNKPDKNKDDIVTINDLYARIEEFNSSFGTRGR